MSVFVVCARAGGMRTTKSAAAAVAAAAVAAVAVAAVALAACGEKEEPVVTGPAGGPTRLEIAVRPRGEHGAVERRVVTEVPRGVTLRSFAPVPADMACTEIYGGPATARVTGTLDGEPVDARFSRANGCEIARWDRLAPLLGRAPGPSLP